MFPADIEDETKSRHGCLLSIILNRSKGMEEMCIRDRCYIIAPPEVKRAARTRSARDRAGSCTVRNILGRRCTLCRLCRLIRLLCSASCRTKCHHRAEHQCYCSLLHIQIPFLFPLLANSVSPTLTLVSYHISLKKGSRQAKLSQMFQIQDCFFAESMLQLNAV